MAFRIENVEVVSLAFFESKGVEIYRPCDLGVLTANIYHEFVVDEYPNVVITQEIEVLPL